jgi:hypothetical protein
MGHSRDETASLAGVNGINCIHEIDVISIGLAPQSIEFKPWQRQGRVWLRPLKSLDVTWIGKTPSSRRNAGPGSLGIGYSNADHASYGDGGRYPSEPENEG